MYYPYYSDWRVQRPIVVSEAYGDVNGDGVIDRVFLTAVPSSEQGSPFRQHITLEVQDGSTKRIYSIPLDPNANSGYNPTLFLGDFTGDRIKDILIIIDSGGSGALTYNYVYSFVNNQARKLFDFNAYNERNRYKVEYMDGYRVRVTSLATAQVFFIDISARGAEYLNQLYTVDGKLKKPVQGMFDGVSGFYPVDMERDGVYEIQAYQRISGLYEADSFGYVINSLQWDGQHFAVWQQWLAIFGSPLLP